MRLLDVLQRGTAPPTESRYSVDDYMQMAFNGSSYIVGANGSKPDSVDAGFVSHVQRVHERHGVVAAAVVTRSLLLSQVRFKWKRLDGSLYGNRDLLPLEKPGSYTRPEFLSRLEHDVSYSGTALVGRRGNELFRLPPDKTTFIITSVSDPQWKGDTLEPPYDARVVGLTYTPGGKGNTQNVEVFTPGDFCVWAPEPDPVYWWRGTSWITSVMREVLLDGQVTDHESKFFEKAATPGLVFMMDPSRSPDEIKAYQEAVDRKFAGNQNSYKNMFLGGATDVKVVGSSLSDLGLGELQGTFENRVAVRSRIPAVVLGTKEALSGSSLNAGNYAAARRMLADGWFAPTVDNLCAALESLLSVPADGTELGYDRNAVLFLQEDQKDAADITQTNSIAMRQLVEAGFDPATVIDAVVTGDMTKLSHTGNVSVQLQPPATGQVDTEMKAVDPFGEMMRMRPDPQQLTVNMPDQSFTLALPEQRAPDIHVDGPTIHVPEQRMDAPQVTVVVDPTPVTIDNTVDVSPTPVTIDNRVEVAPAKVPPAQVTVMPAAETSSTYKVNRDRDGRISEVVEED